MTSNIDAEAHLGALRFSVARLRDSTSGIADATLTKSAYPSEWSIAQVLSHLGSSAQIMQRRLEDSLVGQQTPDDFPPGVWSVWDAKTPTEQRDDSLRADAEFLARIEAVTSEQRSTFTFSIGPISVDFTEFVDLRLNEHAMHSWDIDVALDPTATIPTRVAALVVDNLELVARYTGKPTGETSTITVTTADPARGFTVQLTPDSVTFAPSDPMPDADLELPAEAFARLVYGRLNDQDGDRAQSDAVNVLRRVFPGP